MLRWLKSRRSEQLDAEIGGEWQGMMLHKDYSARKKLHIDIRLPLGMTVPEAQRAYCKALGVPPDTSCFTPERFIYITPAEYEIYRADGWYAQLTEEEIAERRKAYTDRGLSIDGRDSSGSYYDTGSTESTEGPVTPVSSENSVRTFPNEFKGIPYTSIIGEYWRRTGGEPSEGERNKRLHQLAANLRAVCDNSEEWLLELMPSFGLTALEMRSIVHSACKEPTKGSKLMDQIVNSLKGGVLSDDVDDDEEDKVQSSKFQVQSNKLPIGLKESLSGVPVSMHMPVLCSVLPARSFRWNPFVYDAPAQIRELNAKIRAYAERNKITYVDYYSAMVDADGGLKPGLSNDEVHPTEEGYKMMEPIILHALKKGK